MAETKGPIMNLHRYRLAAAGLPIVALVAAGCAGTSGTTTNSAPSPAPGNASVATLSVAGGSLGQHLVDGAGRTVYLWEKDGTGPSQCSGECLTVWPAVTSGAAPKAGAGVQPGLLGTVGGSQQVSYHGHPLYYFAGDTSAGSTSGQGNDGFGAKWWVVAPTGDAITTMGGSGGSSGGGGYTY